MGETTRTGKLVIDLCIVNGIVGCAIECYPLGDWEVVSKAEMSGKRWPSVEQQYEAVQSGAEALVWAYDAWFGVRRKQ